MPTIYKVSFKKVADVSRAEATAIESLRCSLDDPAQEGFIFVRFRWTHHKGQV